MTTIARLIVNSPDDAYALLPLDPDAALMRRLDAEALAVGFRLMPDDECPAEITADGWLKVWAAGTDTSDPIAAVRSAEGEARRLHIANECQAGEWSCSYCEGTAKLRFESDEEWVSYWLARLAPTTHEELRQIGELLALQLGSRAAGEGA